MKAVFKREFRALLHSIRGIVFLGTFLFAAGIFTVLYTFNKNAAHFEVALSYLLPILVFTLPILSMDSFADERANGTDRLLDILPLQVKDIVLGKYFARLCVWGLPLAIFFTYPLILDLYGEVNYLIAYASILALFLVGAVLLAVGMFIAVKTPNRRYALVISYIVFCFWYASGLLAHFYPTAPIWSWIAFLVLAVIFGAIALLWTKKWQLAVPIALFAALPSTLCWFFRRDLLGGAFEKLLRDISPFLSFDDFVFGLFDFRTVLWYALLASLFVGLTAVAYRKSSGKDMQTKGGFARRMTAATLSLVLIGGAILGGFGIFLLPKRLTRGDISLLGSYTLSKETKQFLSELERDVTVWVLNPDNSDRRFELFLDRMTDYTDRLTVQKIDTEESPEFLTEHGLDGTEIAPYSIVVEGAAREQYVGYYSLFSFSNATLGFTDMSASNYQYYMYLFSSDTQYNDYLSSLLYETVQYFEGETVISSLIEYVAADTIPTIYFMGGHENDISESLVAYVLASYGSKYKMLDIHEGGSIPEDASSVILPTPASDLSDSELAALRAYLQSGGQLTVLTDGENLSMPNLCALLADYQLQASSAHLAQRVTEGEGEESRETTTLTLLPNFDHDVMAPLSEESSFSVKVSDTCAILYPENPQGSLLITPILSTDAEAYPVGAEDMKGTYTVAVAAEKAEGDRLVWFTGAESYLGGENPDEQQLYNAVCVMAATNWTSKTYTSELSKATPSVYSSSYLTVGEGVVTIWGIILIAVIPAVVVSLGIMTWYKRKKA